MDSTTKQTLIVAAGTAAVAAAAPSVCAAVLRARGRSWSRRSRTGYGRSVIVGWDFYEYTVRVHLPLWIPRYWRSEEEYEER